MRSCKDPECDNYFGSFKDKTFKPTEKIILAVLSTREEAVAAEILLHKFFDVSHNPHFANQVCQTSTGYDVLGVKWGPRSEETKQKMRDNHKGRRGQKCSPETLERMRNAKLGKVCSEEHRRNVGLSRKGKTLSEEHKKKLSESAKSYWKNKQS